MVNEKEIKSIKNIFYQKVKKKIYIISALKHKGLDDLKKNLFTYVYK